LYGLITFLTLPVQALAAGKIVKWVDDKGETHYGDSIPPEYSGQQHSVISKQGTTVSSKAAAKTPEEIAAQKLEDERLGKLAAEEKQRAGVQAEQDRILLDTFVSEDDIVQTRDRRIADIETLIKNTQGNSEKLQKRLAGLRAQADGLQKTGKPVPELMQKDIKEAEAQQTAYASFIDTKHGEQEALRVQAEVDLKRFRELHANKTAQQP
jgi:hypothetical protein